MGDDEVLLRLRNALEQLPGSDRRDALVLALGGPGAVTATCVLGRVLGPARLEDALPWAALTLCLEDAGLPGPPRIILERLRDGGLNAALLPAGASRVYAGPGAESLAPLLAALGANVPEAPAVRLIVPRLSTREGTLSTGIPSLPTVGGASRLTPQQEDELADQLENAPRGLAAMPLG